MILMFYIAAAIAVFSTLMMLTRLHAVHALLYLVVALLAVAVVFYTLGAPFIAALEVIIYAGAIMVLFVFVVMLLNLGVRATTIEREWLRPTMYIGPAHSVGPAPRRDRRYAFPESYSGRVGECRAEGSRSCSVRSLPDRGRTRVHAVAGRAGGRLPPGRRQA